MNFADTPVETLSFEAERLMAEHPPAWRDRNKRIVYAIACPPGCRHRGHLTYTRWRGMALPERASPAAAILRVERREDVYDYLPILRESGAIEWHVNFADSQLFVAYGSGLFAQDEMQVAEHPSLGALKEALTARGASPRTVERDRPTPILVMGAERRCRVATEQNDDEGTPIGIYGNAFAVAPAEVIRRATTRIDPPTVTNLIAIAAPSGGCGRYTASEIERVVTTAYTGFRAAVLQAGDSPTVVHTGFWGCGAFGGNRVLMAVLQVLAGQMAGVERLVFHTVDADGSDAFDAALGWIEEMLSESSIETRNLMDRVAAEGFEWGESDGN
jgi:hypothetical protein